MNTLRTHKGTRLPLLNLKGKDYLQVCHRLLWFREQHPDWSIQTEYLKLEELFSICKATIYDPAGKIMATAHKREDKKDFNDFIEKSETSAIGRALALCGFGTQFEPEFDEGARVVDSPIADQRQVKPEQPGPEDGIQKDDYHFKAVAGDNSLAQRSISNVSTPELKAFVDKLDLKYEGKEMPPKTLEAHSEAINEILKREGCLDEQEDDSFEKFVVVRR